MNEIQRTEDWFKLAVPEPKERNMTTQLGCHIEEIVEMLLVLTSGDTTTNNAIHRSVHNLQVLSKKLKEGSHLHIMDKCEFLDALTDQIVTSIGSSYMFGMQGVDALREVNDSNYSKFVDGKPVFNEQGKIMKGIHYRKPNLTNYVGD